MIVGAVAILAVIGGGFYVTSGKSATSGAGLQDATAQQAIAATQGAGTTTNTTYTLADVAAHATASDCWLAIDGKVYNVTSFIPKHPGGVQAIISACGTDATHAFHSQPRHEGSQAQNMLQSLYIGSLSS